MADEPGPIAALTAALTTLLPLADPGRAEAVLRQAIVRLAGAEDRRQLQTREPLAGPDVDDWARLKAQLRASSVAGAEIARQIGVSRSALDHCLSPAGRTPSSSLFAKLQTWLEEHQAAVKPPIAPKPNGSKPAAAPEAPPAPRSPGRLSSQEREALAAYIGRPDAEIRTRFNATPELVRRAIGGAIVPAEVIERIAAGLANGKANGAA